MSASLFCFFLSPAQPGSPFACHWNNAVFNQNVATMWPGRNRKTDLGEINRPTVTTHIAGVAWPSGLRRWFKAPVSSEAWVRIPPLPRLFFCNPSFFTHYSCYSRHHHRRSGQVVRRRSRKPKITGSNPVCAFFFSPRPHAP